MTGRYSVAHCIQLNHSMELSFLLNAGGEYCDVETNPILHLKTFKFRILTRAGPSLFYVQTRFLISSSISQNLSNSKERKRRESQEIP